MKHRPTKEMEYEEAPSGYVRLYNYKEPFMKFKGGFGYRGVLLFDGKSDTVQCHLCGKWFESLGRHIALHGLRASEYKEEVGLRKTTALISESFRAKLIANGLDKRLQNLRKMGKHKESSKQKIRETLKKNGSINESQNEYGTCPEQIIDRLIKQAKHEGKTPSTKSLPFYEAMIKIFGSYKEACRFAGIPYNDPVEALKRGHATLRAKRREREDEAIALLIKFKQLNGRYPSTSDCRRGLLPNMKTYQRYFGGWKKSLLKAFPEYKS